MANVNDSELSLCRSTTSISNIIGGLSSFMLNYFKMKFPEGTFKETYIADSLNSNLLRRNSFPNQKRPFIGMEIEYTGEEGFMGTLPMHHTPQYFIANKGRKYHYRVIFEDLENDIRIYSIPNRIKVNFNFLMKYQTKMAAIDAMHYIQNNFEYNGINYINGVRLPCEVPRYFIDNISKKLGFNQNDPNDRDELKDYLLSHSLGSISEIVNLSTGNMTFMHEYTTNIMLNYPENPMTNVNPNNLVIKDASVSFSINAEIWSPSGFLLEIKDDKLPTNIYPEQDDSFKFNLVFRKDIIPMTLDNGMKYILIGSFIPEVNQNNVDELDIRPILTNELANVLSSLMALNANVRNLIDIKVFENNKFISDSMYSIDYSTFILTTIEPKENTTYNLVLYGDIKMLNIVNDLLMNQNYNAIKRLDIF